MTLRLFSCEEERSRWEMQLSFPFLKKEKEPWGARGGGSSGGGGGRGAALNFQGLRGKRERQRQDNEKLISLAVFFFEND